MAENVVPIFAELRARDVDTARKFDEVGRKGKASGEKIAQGFGKADKSFDLAKGKLLQFVGAFASVEIAAQIVRSLANAWIETEKATAKARKELELYSVLRFATGELTEQLEKNARAIQSAVRPGRVTEAESKVLAVAADQFGISIRRAEELAVVAKEVADTYQVDLLNAFRALAKAEKGAFDPLQEILPTAIRNAKEYQATLDRLVIPSLERLAQIQRLAVRTLETTAGPDSPATQRARGRLGAIEAEIRVLRQSAIELQSKASVELEAAEAAKEHAAQQERVAAVAKRVSDELKINAEALKEIKQEQQSYRELINLTITFGDALGFAFGEGVSGARSFREAFADLSDFLIIELSRLTAKFATLFLLKSLLDGSIGSGFNAAIQASFGEGLKFAQGGTMQGRMGKPVELPRGLNFESYQFGGVADRPTLALFGEGGGGEAFVPLQGGRIPVELRGGGGLTVVNNFNNLDNAQAGEFLERHEQRIVSMNARQLGLNTTFRRIVRGVR